MRVEARRARKRSNNKYAILDLDFVDDEELSPGERALYGAGTLGCVIIALIGAVFPVIPAIPFWGLAVVCLSHTFPGFGRFVRDSRAYQWLIEKLNEPEVKAKRPVMTRRRKDQINTGIAVGLAAIWVAVWFVATEYGLIFWLVTAFVIVAYIISWFVIYVYFREPEATIRTKRKLQQRKPVQANGTQAGNTQGKAAGSQNPRQTREQH